MENEVLDYVMNTPGNTNPAILKQMLGQDESGGGSTELLIVNTTETGIDASYNEIKAAVLAGKAVWLYLEDSEYSIVLYKPLVALGIDTGYYFCAFSDDNNRSTYGSEDADTDMSSVGGAEPIEEH